MSGGGIGGGSGGGGGGVAGGGVSCNSVSCHGTIPSDNISYTINKKHIAHDISW